MKVNREQLLSELEPILPGLSPREVIEQSSCFVFKDGTAVTFNDEIACSHKTCLDDVTGAVRAEPLMGVLRRMKEEVVDINQKNGELIVKGTRKESGVGMEKKILLPIESLERPKEWKKIPEGFSEAIDLAQQCAGKDETQFVTTCIHIHPKWVEATDNWQLIRCPIEMNLKGPCLVRHQSIKNVVSMGFTRFAETEAWLHFKNKEGLMMSCRRHLDDYIDMTPFLKVKGGEKMTLPKGLADSVETAEIFTSENQDNNLVSIELRKGKMRVRGTGLSGWYKEMKQLDYSGPSLRFLISPKLLAEISQKYNDCVVTKNRLKVDGGNFSYIACLTVAEEEE